MISKFLFFQPPVPSETKGRSLRSGRTLPDPSVHPDPLLVEGESGESEGGTEGGGNGSGDEGELWVDNERYTHTIVMVTSL